MIAKWHSTKIVSVRPIANLKFRQFLQRLRFVEFTDLIQYLSSLGNPAFGEEPAWGLGDKPKEAETVINGAITLGELNLRHITCISFFNKHMTVDYLPRIIAEVTSYCDRAKPQCTAAL